MSLERLKTVYFLGSLINNVKGIFNKTNELVDAVNALETNTTSRYTVYTPIVSQANGTANLTVIELENTIGTITVARLNTGVYTFTSSGKFIIDKTYISGFGDYGDLGDTYFPLASNSGLLGYYCFSQVGNSNLIQLNTVNTSFVSTDLFDLIGLTKLCLPEIRVYN